jgi:hypothetical protein
MSGPTQKVGPPLTSGAAHYARVSLDKATVIDALPAPPIGKCPRLPRPERRLPIAAARTGTHPKADVCAIPQMCGLGQRAGRA